MAMERFEFVSSLGEGAYGQVWKCLDKETGQMVAMKRFKEAHLDEEVMRLVLREIRLLKASSHPNVVALQEAFKSKSGRVYMVMEHVDHTLTEQLKKSPFGFSPKSVKLITWQLLQATAFLHSSRIIHRDLKPANILLSEDGKVKLCDFGFARTIRASDIADYTQYVVTRWYRPPELLVGGAYGTPADVWAIGCLFGEMATGRPVFPGRDTLDQLWLTMRTVGPLPLWQMQLLKHDEKMSAVSIPVAAELRPLNRRFALFDPQMMEVIKACLQPEPVKRLTALQVLALPYFDDIHELLKGSIDLQQDYDQAYSAATKMASPSAPCLWTSSSGCLAQRATVAAAKAAAAAAAKTAAAAEKKSAAAAAVATATSAAAVSAAAVSTIALKVSPAVASPVDASPATATPAVDLSEAAVEQAAVKAPAAGAAAVSQSAENVSKESAAFAPSEPAVAAVAVAAVVAPAVDTPAHSMPLVDSTPSVGGRAEVAPSVVGGAEVAEPVPSAPKATEDAHPNGTCDGNSNSKLNLKTSVGDALLAAVRAGSSSAHMPRPLEESSVAQSEAGAHVESSGSGADLKTKRVADLSHMNRHRASEGNMGRVENVEMSSSYLDSQDADLQHLAYSMGLAETPMMPSSGLPTPSAALPHQQHQPRLASSLSRHLPQALRKSQDYLTRSLTFTTSNRGTPLQPRAAGSGYLNGDSSESGVGQQQLAPQPATKRSSHTRRSLVQVVKAFGVRLEAFVSRPFASQVIRSREPGQGTERCGMRLPSQPAVSDLASSVAALVEQGPRASHRASTGCILRPDGLAASSSVDGTMHSSNIHQSMPAGAAGFVNNEANLLRANAFMGDAANIMTSLPAWHTSNDRIRKSEISSSRFQRTSSIKNEHSSRRHQLEEKADMSSTSGGNALQDSGKGLQSQLGNESNGFRAAKGGNSGSPKVGTSVTGQASGSKG